jgi:methylmalonyl-CoA/ethylmalonyl-CoA epimerase
MRLEHIGIAVDDVALALETFEDLLGRSAYKREIVESENVVTHFFEVDGVKIELLEATQDDSPVGRFVQKRGGGIHHLAFQVDDLDSTRRRLEQSGYRILSEPKPGADGKRIFFLHPADTAGVLVEYCSQDSAG